MFNRKRERNFKQSKIKLSNIKKRQNVYWTNEQLLIKKDILENGFNVDKSPPFLLTKDMVLVNGNHRYMILKEKYGDSFEVDSYISTLNYVPMVTLLIMREMIKFILPEPTKTFFDVKTINLLIKFGVVNKIY